MNKLIERLEKEVQRAWKYYEETRDATYRNESNGIEHALSIIRGMCEAGEVVVPTRCDDCCHYRAQYINNGTPGGYVCCRTNGYSPGGRHYCAWAVIDVEVSKAERLTTACVARMAESERRNKE